MDSLYLSISEAVAAAAILTIETWYALLMTKKAISLGGREGNPFTNALGTRGTILFRVLVITYVCSYSVVSLYGIYAIIGVCIVFGVDAIWDTYVVMWLQTNKHAQVGS